MQTNPKLRIAVVAGDDAVRDSTAVLLSAAGSFVQVYPSGEAFLTDARSHHADRLVLHQEASGKSGIDLLRRLRRRGVNIPAIVITADAPAKPHALCRELAIEAVLPGPVVATDLLRLLRVRALTVD